LNINKNELNKVVKGVNNGHNANQLVSVGGEDKDSVDLSERDHPPHDQSDYCGDNLNDRLNNHIKHLEDINVLVNLSFNLNDAVY